MYLSNCDNLACLSFTIGHNGGSGIEIADNSDDNQFVTGKISSNSVSGVKVTETSDRNVFSGLVCSSNASYGIDISAASCDNNMISACALVSNTAGQLNNSGTGTKLRGSIGSIDVG